MTREEHIANWLVLYLQRRHMLHILEETFDRTRSNEADFYDLAIDMAKLDDAIWNAWEGYTVLVQGY